ncbi:hypothetical protein GXP67_17305 [Rhodocytophaga rosea]|uniref:Uncharacterized protein n=1 Tax=Rhodocytophaga rosea TaxID=2704465 RepID=A0A6C0GKV0_9BACT|nr:hypothetical protein [Rhodocytophaga rosea]QHT68272.1 hypothetical protein GXP67_17305 [Rhodocytophaga rosea]
MEIITPSEGEAPIQSQPGKPSGKKFGKSKEEYLADALLIVFSVLLALILNEIRNNWMERSQTREMLRNVRTELINNKQLLQQQYEYHLLVLHNIDSALVNEAYSKQFISQGELHLEAFAPDGIMLEDFDWTAWETAKSNNISSKIDPATMSLLNNISRQHQRIEKIEDEIAKVLLTRESRRPENLRQSLILVKDNYKGWAIDRTPGLLNTYAEAIEKLKDFQ